jgi:peptidoglycan/LPS O-acetylase OafA/YrhL
MKSIAAIFQPEGHPLHPGYRPDIDGLRAVAILSVLAFHAWPKVMRGGFVGVDIFFVISGYLITGIIAGNIDTGGFTIRGFYSRRIRRIFPALILVLLATLLLGAIVLFPSEYTQLGWHTVVAGFFSSNLQLWSETGYFDPAAEVKPLLHLWSLGIEEQFYLLWPLLLLMVARWKHSRIAVVLTIALASFLFYMGLYKSQGSAAFYMPFTRFWELLIGAFLALAPARPAETRLLRGLAARFPFLARQGPQLASAAGLLLIGLCLTHSITGARALLPTLGAALMIAAGPAAWLNRHLLANRAAVYIGLISYPLYLWHWPLLSFLHVEDLENVRAVQGLTIGLLLLSFLLAALTYHILERPLRHASLRRTVPYLLASMLLVMLAGGSIVLAKGLPARFKAQDRAMIAYATEEQDARKAVFRQRACFLDVDQDRSSFVPACANAAADLFLWGDSHAAHLYSGLSGLVPRLSQYTATECPPLLDFRTSFVSNDHCPTINHAVLSKLTAQHPCVAILAAYWPFYFREPGFAESLSRTISEVRGHADEVVLVGPAVSYAGPQLRRAMRLSGADMLRDDQLPDLRASDMVLRKAATALGIKYVSPVSALCSGDSCRAFVPGSPNRLFAFDYGHLTRAGSEYYARKLIAPALSDIVCPARAGSQSFGHEGKAASILQQ